MLVNEIGTVSTVTLASSGSLHYFFVSVGGQTLQIHVCEWTGAIPELGDLVGVNRNRYGNVIKAWELPDWCG
jgi:hypothetical protein